MVCGYWPYRMASLPLLSARSMISDDARDGNSHMLVSGRDCAVKYLLQTLEQSRITVARTLPGLVGSALTI